MEKMTTKPSNFEPLAFVSAAINAKLQPGVALTTAPNASKKPKLHALSENVMKEGNANIKF